MHLCLSRYSHVFMCGDFLHFILDARNCTRLCPARGFLYDKMRPHVIGVIRKSQDSVAA